MLDHPTVDLLTGLFGLTFLPAWPTMGHAAEYSHHFLHLDVSVACVQVQEVVTASRPTRDEFLAWRPDCWLICFLSASCCIN